MSVQEMPVTTSLGSPADSEMVARARAGADALAASDADSAAQARLSDQAWSALQDIGILRALQPARWGGAETTIADFADTIVEIGRASASAGWVAAVVSVHAWQIALFEPETQEEIWGRDPARAIASSYTPTGRVARHPDGWEVSGRWSFSSGIERCDGVILGGIAGTREIAGGTFPDFVSVILDPDQYRVEHTWHVAGLKGTGSHDVVVDGVIVPERRGQSHLLYTKGLGTPLPGQALNESPLYRVPWAVLFNLVVTAGALGAAQGFLDTWVEETKGRRTNYGVLLREEPIVQSHLAEAAWLIDGARLRMRRTAVEMLESAAAGVIPTPEQRAFQRWDLARSAQSAADAVARLMRVASGRTAFLDHPLHRRYQDVNAAVAHAFLFPDPLAQAWAGRHLGSVNPVEVHL